MLYPEWVVSGLLYLPGGLVKALKDYFSPFLVVVAVTTGGAAATGAEFLTNNRVLTWIAGVLMAGLTALAAAVGRKIVENIGQRMDRFFLDFEMMQVNVARMDRSLEILATTVAHHEQFEEEVTRKFERLEGRVDQTETAVAVLQERTRLVPQPPHLG